ncbi:type II toxin-antitoxin system Phd/YefM family antitoxin [Actinomadura nitritigenes]|uniref:type II toxin-antitoxin system Phd/YefM family antitoxin n=1 Tax=Actinomadura nitritigenes TaxID=134602 RepID=UPI003D9130E1
MPISNVSAPLDSLPAWPLSEARAKLGDVVRKATSAPMPRPQILTRHGRPVLAVIAATELEKQETGDGRLDIEALLQAGASLQVTFELNEQADADFREPEYVARVYSSGGLIAIGAGASLGEALDALHALPAPDMFEPPF